MSPVNNKNVDEILLSKLREILLREEREKLASIENKLHEPAYLEDRITPIFEEQLTQLKQNFPKEYEAAVNKLIEEKLQNSQEEIVNLIYPTLGKMIKKYVNLQIQLFKDGVDERIKNTITVKTVVQRVKASIFGVKESDVIFSNIKDYQIEEVFLIEKNSGLLVGTASRGTTIDKEVVGGMLTAIKSFGEDAFKKGEQDLSSINYDSFKIILQSFYSYYVALVISGSISSVQQAELGDEVLDFAEEHLKGISTQNRDDNMESISKELYNNFLV